ncbi:MAG TPA: hypothetical protein VNJ49_03185 [Bradyrhizobium sp.]|nr:hypothetical protein [Bradyrhizobium sp.]
MATKFEIDLAKVNALLDEVEALMREMEPEETLYAFTARESAKGKFLLRWLVKTVEDDPSPVIARSPRTSVH